MLGGAIMKCPVCKDTTLLMAEKHGIEIDYCPECRGIWLDRGELDKIIERASDQKTSSSHSHVKLTKKKKGFGLTDILEMFGEE